MALTWKEQLKKKIIQKWGNKKGHPLNQHYESGFSRSYIDYYSPDAAVSDIEFMEMLSDENPIYIHFYLMPKQIDRPLHLRVFQWINPIPLSDILPILENLDLRVLNERPQEIHLTKDKTIWISDFSVIYSKSHFDLKKMQKNFQDAFSEACLGHVENDGFNKLILGAGLSWREVMIVRAYAKYLRQIGFRFTQTYIESALNNNVDIAINLIKLFKIKHDPANKNKKKNQAKKIETTILSALESVSSLDEDLIIRRLIDLINATLRTNYFKIENDVLRKSSIALKFDSRSIPQMPLPVPLYEVFVYSPYYEAIHLRYTKVARGGIRWSDRPEDFRTEILGLMKTQTVKNAGIIPSGAKGGFVLKSLTKAEVIEGYQDFIRGLLDLADNIKKNKVIFAKNIIHYDDEDPYLVVAADKGTSTFSDIANTISKEYDFWLGDAFASGGSTGYDHKKMGITARGAWESIKRQFREYEIDVTKKGITIVGIGDMSGDVFGNGMLYSKHIKLVAAFDYRDIFLDPTPEKSAYAERARLFKLPYSSWQDYNLNLISKGGGVYKRSSKSIVISPEVKKILDIDDDALPPNELIKAILKAKVDLLYNGGIGTYVKASFESDASVEDRGNDLCRVNGDELRCKVVCEGGNLGFTQLARVEYAFAGGLINTDFIDNSAGVDCSDHEVNLKILLDQVVANGGLSLKKRNTLLESLTNDVAALVLEDNYSQSLAMSFLTYYSNSNIGLHHEYIKELESHDELNRKVEFLPDDKKLLELKASGKGLTTPELAVLYAYTKIHIKHAILETDLPDDPFLSEILATAFPAVIQKKYHAEMNKHYLRKNIIATQLSNNLVNEMGVIFVYRQQIETGASISDIVRAYAIASRVFGTAELSRLVSSLNFKLPMNMQYEILYNFRKLVSISTRWFLKNNRFKDDLQKTILYYSDRVKKLNYLIPDLMVGFTKEYLDWLSAIFFKVGLSKKDAKEIGIRRSMYTLLNVIEVASLNKFDLVETAQVYFLVGEYFNLVWFRDQIANDRRSGYWNSVARLTLRDELDLAQRTLTEIIIKGGLRNEAARALICKWIDEHPLVMNRWSKLLAMLHGTATVDYTMFFVALRELSALI